MGRRRQLIGVAVSMAQKFSVSAAHFAYVAWSSDIQTVCIDLLTGAISTNQFDVARNRTLAQYCSENLAQIMSDPMRIELQEATLEATFGDVWLQRYTQSRIVVSLTDERGKVWVGKHVENHQLIDPPAEGIGPINAIQRDATSTGSAPSP